MTRRRYLLDTNIASFVIKGSRPAVLERLARHQRNTIGVSVITEMELRFGLERLRLQRGFSDGPLKWRVDEFLAAVPVLPLPTDVADAYSSLRATLEKSGRAIGPLDTIIASHAVAIGAVLVTNNVKEFGRVPGLRLEDWS